MQLVSVNQHVLVKFKFHLYKHSYSGKTEHKYNNPDEVQILYDSHRATDWKWFKYFFKYFSFGFSFVTFCNFIFSFCFLIMLLFSFIFIFWMFFFRFVFLQSSFFHFKHVFFISNFIVFSFSLPVAPEIQENHENQWKTIGNKRK